MADVAATPRANELEVLNGDMPGAFVITTDAGMHLFCECPCGCGGHMNLPIYVDAKPSTVAWRWDGDCDKPTLEPSIRDLSGCLFHGWLRAGVWSFAGDSGRKS